MDIDNILNSLQQTPLLTPSMIGKVAVLYSHSQKCFHIESIMEYITENFNLSVTGKEGDYRMLGITENEYAAHNLIEEIKAGFAFLNYRY